MNLSEKTVPFKPREISKIDATIFRELIFSKRLLAIFPKDHAKKIRFFEANSSYGIDKKFSFSLQVGQQKVDLSIELKPGTPLFKRLEEVGGIESLPEEFRVGLMAFAGREIIEVLEQLFQLPVTIWNAANTQEESSEKKELYFEVLDPQGTCEARASIILSLALVERVLALAQETPMLRSLSLKGELLQGEVFIGSTTVSLEDWKRLRPRDLIVIQEPSALKEGQGKCLIKKSGVIPIAVKPDFFKPLLLPLENLPLVVQSHSCQGGDPSHEVEEKKRALSTSIPITLELNFSAGLVSLTIQEALQLMKTKVLEKRFQLLKPLKIFIQEQVVGTGELVEINGLYALAITQLFDYAS